mmetsp:Transcript_27625/g.110619  ORF Transcript_27625/g.110619 Transcript_27625/m.110619 type:complete len:349 (+) Transcript_27625:91-1137(+)
MTPRAFTTLLVVVGGASALVAPRLGVSSAIRPLQMAATIEPPPVTTPRVTTPATLLPRERYVASNRFVTRDGDAAAKFEARWANRKSRLATLDGFRYFALFREVPLADVVGERGAAAMGGAPLKYNYMSFTIWQDKPAFDEWRNGEAFKEAHGGTGIGAFLTAMVGSLRVLKGPPSPVFWDGILHLANPPKDDPTKVVDAGWRVVEADGASTLPAECFVAANRFEVREGAEADFEERWSKRDSNLVDMPGFKSFTMLRRDAPPVSSDPMGDAWNYMSFTVWDDKASFMNWRNSQSFKDAHGGGSSSKAAKATEGEAAAAAPRPPAPWVRPPSVMFWEGVLELTAPEGA